MSRVPGPREPWNPGTEATAGEPCYYFSNRGLDLEKLSAKANSHSGAQLECETQGFCVLQYPSVYQRMMRTFSWGPQGHAEEGLDPSSKTCYSFPESRGYSLSQNPSATHHLHTQLSNLSVFFFTAVLRHNLHIRKPCFK